MRWTATRGDELVWTAAIPARFYSGEREAEFTFGLTTPAGRSFYCAWAIGSWKDEVSSIRVY
jgi:hypothetical protein